MRCERCGEKLTQTNTNIHHKKYRSEGGGDEPENLQVLCRDCHITIHRDDFSVWGKRGWINLCRNIAKGFDDSEKSRIISEYMRQLAKKRWQRNV